MSSTTTERVHGFDPKHSGLTNPFFDAFELEETPAAHELRSLFESVLERNFPNTYRPKADAPAAEDTASKYVHGFRYAVRGDDAYEWKKVFHARKEEALSKDIFTRFRGKTITDAPFLMTPHAIDMMDAVFRKSGDGNGLSMDEKQHFAKLIEPAYAEFKAFCAKQFVTQENLSFAENVDPFNCIALASDYAGYKDLFDTAIANLTENESFMAQHPHYATLPNYTNGFGVYMQAFMAFPEFFDEVKRLSLADANEAVKASWEEHIEPLVPQEGGDAVNVERDVQTVQAFVQNAFAAANACYNKGDFIEWIDLASSAETTASGRPKLNLMPESRKPKSVSINAQTILKHWPSQDKMDQLVQKLEQSDRRAEPPKTINMGSRMIPGIFKSRIENPYANAFMHKALTEGYDAANAAIERLKEKGQWEDVQASLAKGNSIG